MRSPPVRTVRGRAGVAGSDIFPRRFFAADRRDDANSSMTLLARIVSTSHTVARHTSRTAKVAELAACLRSLEPSEIETGVLYLSGETTQGKSGIGYAALEAASADPPATTATLTIGDVDSALTGVAQIRGTGA